MPRNVTPDVVDETLDNLIRQFSQELCFYRELIQNAIDAGSPTVDVQVAWQADAGLAEIQVVDYGEGMDRRIIDTQLTRLFSSSKEDDYTKIGKFGIGFVSVFAVKPEAVVVETGRGGERWRVLFGPDRQFERLVLDDPVEGTRVRIYKKMAQKAFPDFVKRSRDTVIYWCRHASAEIRFQGEVVNEPFQVPSAVRVTREEQGTLVVLGLTTQSPAFFGFYNQGITLLEGQRDFIPGVTFKARSRYLEHTLTRDNVVQDENYAKAMAIIEGMVSSALLPELLTRLAAAAAEADERGWEELLALGQAHMEAAWRSAEGQQVPVLRCVGRAACSYAELRRSMVGVGALRRDLQGVSKPCVLYAERLSPRLIEHLGRWGIVVLQATAKHRIVRLLERLGCAVADAAALFGAPAPVVEGDLPPGAVDLAQAVVDLLVACGVPVASLKWARFDDDRALAGRALLVQARPGPIVPVDAGGALAEDQAPTVWPLSLVGRRHVLVNASHPLVQRLMAAWCAHPTHATHQLAKLVCLADGIHPELEKRLSKWALRQRGEAGAVVG